MAFGARKTRREENQEDSKHALEVIWEYDPDSALCKIFSREARGRTNENINLSKEDLEDLT